MWITLWRRATAGAFFTIALSATSEASLWAVTPAQPQPAAAKQHMVHAFQTWHIMRKQLSNGRLQAQASAQAHHYKKWSQTIRMSGEEKKIQMAQHSQQRAMAQKTWWQQFQVRRRR